MKLIIKIQSLVFFILLVVMGLSMNLMLDVGLAFQMQYYKKIILLLFIIISILTIRINNQNSRLTHARLLLLLFPIYYLIISFFYKYEFNLLVITMYFLWWFYISVISPILVSNEKNRKIILRYIILASFTILIYGFYAYLNDEGFFQKSRLSFGYENPNFFAQYLQIGILSYIFLNKGLKEINKITWLFIFLIFFLIISTISRNVIFFLVIFFLWFFLYNLRVKFFVKTIAIILFIFVLSSFSFNQINSYSSGRLVAWNYQIDKLFTQDGYAVLFGARKYIDQHYSVLSYSRFNQEIGFVKNQKIHSDNIFLEIFLESGLIGFILFLVPFIYSWISIKNMTITNKRLYQSLYIAAIVQGLFITNFTSFFSPTSLVLGLLFLAPTYVQKK